MCDKALLSAKEILLGICFIYSNALVVSFHKPFRNVQVFSIPVTNALPTGFKNSYVSLSTLPINLKPFLVPSKKSLTSLPVIPIAAKTPLPIISTVFQSNPDALSLIDFPIVFTLPTIPFFLPYNSFNLSLVLPSLSPSPSLSNGFFFLIPCCCSFSRIVNSFCSIALDFCKSSSTIFSSLFLLGLLLLGLVSSIVSILLLIDLEAVSLSSLGASSFILFSFTLSCSVLRIFPTLVVNALRSDIVLFSSFSVENFVIALISTFLELLVANKVLLDLLLSLIICFISLVLSLFLLLISFLDIVSSVVFICLLVDSLFLILVSVCSSLCSSFVLKKLLRPDVSLLRNDVVTISSFFLISFNSSSLVVNLLIEFISISLLFLITDGVLIEPTLAANLLSIFSVGSSLLSDLVFLDLVSSDFTFIGVTSLGVASTTSPILLLIGFVFPLSFLDSTFVDSSSFVLKTLLILEVNLLKNVETAVSSLFNPSLVVENFVIEAISVFSGLAIINEVLLLDSALLSKTPFIFSVVFSLFLIFSSFNLEASSL